MAEFNDDYIRNVSTLEPISLTIPNDCGGLRLDQALAKLFPAYSRSRLQSWIRQGLVSVSGRPAEAKQKVWGGELIVVAPQPSPEESAFKAQDIPLNIVFEDEHILVIDKPAGLVVHPAAGNWEGTLLNALLHYTPQVEAVPRAGIVHRLDKETSGLLVVAKTIPAQTDLVRQLQARTVKREYRAIVWGIVHGKGKVDAPIGRNPHDRTKGGGQTFRQARCYVFRGAGDIFLAQLCALSAGNRPHPPDSRSYAVDQGPIGG